MKHLTCLCLAFAMLSGVASADVYFSEIDLENNIVELVNDGGADVDISTWWVCNRVNGSPFYDTVANAFSINGASFEEDGFADLIVEAGDVLVLDVSAGFLPDSNGEFSLYNTNSFGSASAIEDYIAWGGAGVRDNVAQNAGIWTVGDFIDVSSRGGGESIQLAAGFTGNASTDYFFGAPDLGRIAVPEPGSLIALGLTGLALVTRRRK